MVDKFGVKYVGKQHTEHLINTAQKHYKVSMDWEGKRYCEINSNWNDQKQVFKLSMPGYITADVHKFQQR